jgi:hypothetical protein
MNFSVQEIERLTAVLSDCSSRQKQTLLTQILSEWGRIDLEEHLNRTPPTQVLAERKQLEKLARRADELAQLISDLPPDVRFAVAGWELEALSPIEPGSVVYGPKPNVGYQQIQKADRRLSEEPARLKEIAAAASKVASIWEPVTLRHSTTIRYLVLQDLAAIFEYATGEKASRKVRVDPHPDAGHEYGAFWVFANASWQIVFGSTEGLGYAIQWWAAARAEYGEQSPVIRNVRLRHPEWRIFDH